MKIRTVGAELIHAGGRTDGQSGVTNLTRFFAILRKRLKIEQKASVNLIKKGNNKQLFGHYKSPKRGIPDTSVSQKMPFKVLRFIPVCIVRTVLRG
jgi:hypothetical protein